MDEKDAIAALAALAQPTRLQVFRLLVSHAPVGLPAGEAAAALEVPQNTLSSHLSILAHAGLVQAERQGRSMIYRAGLDTLGALMLFLVRDCCNTHPELCSPLLAELACCSPRKTYR